MCAMEQKAKPEIEPTSPRLWVNSLKDFKINNAEDKYSKFLDEVIKVISKQLPRSQLELYSTMIEAAVEIEDVELTDSLCGHFSSVYSEYFHGTIHEAETFSTVVKLRKIVELKKTRHGVLKLLHFSSTGALPPLQEDVSNQVLKTAIPHKNDIHTLESYEEVCQEKNFEEIWCGDCNVFGTIFPSLAVNFFESKIITATSDGSIFVYDCKGRLLSESKKRVKNKKPVLLLEGEFTSHTAMLKVKHLRSGHSVLYAPKDKHIHCCMLGKNVLIAGNVNGELTSERILEETITRHEGHIGAIAALYSLSKSRFLSGSHDGCIKLWSVRKKECKKSMNVGASVNDFTKFDDNLLVLCNYNQIRMLKIHKQKSLLLYESDETIKTIIGFDAFLIACLKNGSLRLWHLEKGFGKTVLLHLNPAICLSRVSRHVNDLFCFYKDGMIIKFPYSFLLKAFTQAMSHNFDSLNNKVPIIKLEI